MATPPAPTTVGRYKVLKPLGEGGMGRIFLAEDPVLGRKLAVKLLPPEVQNDPERRERLVQEARAASALNHPNILVVHDLGEADGLLFVAMELVDGQTLRVWMDSAPGGKPHSPQVSLPLLRQAARGLAAAHGAGIVHRDLKPENLMVRADGILKILDFGLAQTASLGPQDRTVQASPGGSGSPGLTGTVLYMSPEQVLGQAAEPASDLFSLGVILYETLTGEHPFAATHAVDTLQRIVHETPAPPSSRNPALGPQVDFVVAKVLAKDPSRRHTSARDLENDLGALEETLRPAGASRPAEPTPAPVPAAGLNVPSASSIRAVAVLPFKNIGGNPELSYLGMGLADAVITQLATSPDIIVRATSAVAGYENKAIDPRRVGEELEADTVLDASFQQVADRLRATARLVEAATGRALWAGKVEVRSEDVFELQDRVAQGIAEALAARLGSDSKPPRTAGVDLGGAPIGGAEAGSGKHALIPSPAAYDQYLRGLEGRRRWQLEGWKEAILHLEEAVRLEPEFVRAWALLGEVYQSMAASGWDVDAMWFDKAEVALARARALDPEDGHVRFLAGSLHIARGRIAEAWRDLRGAMAKMPHFWATYHYMAYACRLSDRLEEGIEIERRVVGVEPNVPWPYTMAARMEAWRGNPGEAREWLENGRLRAGSHIVFDYGEMGILGSEGRWEELLGRFGEGSGRETMVTREMPVAMAHLRTGSKEKAIRLAHAAEGSAEVDMDAAAEVAKFWAWAGDADRAFRFLDRADELGFHALRVLENPREFGAVHDDPRWKPYIERVRGKVEELREILVWPPA